MNHSSHPSRWMRLRTVAVALALAAGLLLLMAAFMAATGQAAPNGPAVDAAREPSVLAAPLGIQTLGDYVWYDRNANGRYNTAADTGEQQFVGGINDVLVKLYVDGSDGSTRDGILQPSEYMSSTLTGPKTAGTSGWYQFKVTTYYTPTLYWVEVAPSNFDPGGKLAGTTFTSGDTFGPPSGPPIIDAELDVDSLNPVDNMDFGFVGSGAIGDLVWYDTDHDGFEDVGEPGIGNVKVALYRDNGTTAGVLDASDMLVGTEKTGADGGYIFTGLVPGTYFVDVVDAANPNGPLNGLTHVVANQSLPDPTGPIVVAAGEFYEQADFGYYLVTGGNASIGDTVWYDYDADGIQDDNEPGMPGVTVTVTDSNIIPNTYTGTTNANGKYEIVVPVGPTLTYSVQPTAGLPAGSWTATTPVPQGVPPLQAGQKYLDADFGYDSNTLLGVIGNQVWREVVVDGIYDANGADNIAGNADDEPGIPGVSVDLWRDPDLVPTWDGDETIVGDDDDGHARAVHVPGCAGGQLLCDGVGHGERVDRLHAVADYCRAIGDRQSQSRPAVSGDVDCWQSDQQHGGLRVHLEHGSAEPGGDREPALV